MEALNLSQHYWRFMGIVDPSYMDLWDWNLDETIWNQTTFSKEEVFEEILLIDLGFNNLIAMNESMMSLVEVNTVFNGKCFSLHFNFPNIPENGVFLILKNVWKLQDKSVTKVIFCNSDQETELYSD